MLFGLDEFQHYLNRGALDVVQPERDAPGRNDKIG